MFRDTPSFNGIVIIFQFALSNQSKKVLAPPVKKLSCNTIVPIENTDESKGLCTILPSIKSKFPTIFKSEIKKKKRVKEKQTFSRKAS